MYTVEEIPELSPNEPLPDWLPKDLPHGFFWHVSENRARLFKTRANKRKGEDEELFGAFDVFSQKGRCTYYGADEPMEVYKYFKGTPEECAAWLITMVITKGHANG